MQEVKIKNFLIGENQPLTIICGPCIIESEEFALKTAEQLKQIFEKYPFNFIFKSSYDKANRSSINSFRGPGIDKGLKILEKIKKEFNLPLITDIHEIKDAKMAAEVCDILQIPAFLCRQTDLILAAAQTKAAINVKKGQFLAPWDMGNIVEKILSCNNKQIILTDRGTCFGYNNLVSDMRSIPIMKKFGFPVCFDATHSAQLPGGLGTSSGGQREFIPILAKSAIAAGCNALFMEVHPNPAKAKSDSSTSLSFEDLKTLLNSIEKLYKALNAC
jgi:2-dehydro-3-deoxyphosphooctonate aldolase (KDO 8-P synthase)